MKAICGCDFIRNSEWLPVEKSINGWLLWAKREATKKSTGKTTWHPVCHYVEHRNAMRISFASQPENLR